MADGSAFAQSFVELADIKVVPLGAGQDVGRSCILVSIGGKNVMLDCGMHMGYNDERRFPDFSYIAEGGRLTEHLDCVIISHFHLDHCGALPYFTEMVGYDGPLYMTQPTKAICPILLEDYRKITVEKKGETNFFTSQMIKDCMKKVTAVSLHQTVKVDEELEIKAYYAGHVLGAAMFLVRVGTQSFVYTGDYNMTPDRHLGAAWIDRCRPDLLITESTYATTIRDSKRCREQDFLKKVHDCIDKGGKILIPVFALGRAQELCILLESYWDRMNLTAPIYFTMGLTEKANHYYKLFITWTNQKILSTFVERNLFDFKHIKPFDRSYTDLPGPMVVFATPGMLHSGQSLQIFKKWAGDDKNMLIMPGYCVAGTVGHKVLTGQKEIEIDKKTVSVKLAVQYMSFSAHADAKGIMQLIRMAEPKNVLLVHGEAAKMDFLSKKVKQEFGISCYMPANGETVSIATPPVIEATISEKLLKRTVTEMSGVPISKRPYQRPNTAHLHGLLVVRDESLKLIDASEAPDEIGLSEHSLVFKNSITMETRSTEQSELMDRLLQIVCKMFPDVNFLKTADNVLTVSGSSLAITVEPHVGRSTSHTFEVSWNYKDDRLGEGVFTSLQRNLQRLL